MPRADFDRHLRSLQDDLLVLGSMVEKAIAKSLDALKRRDLEASRLVVQEDDAIDQQRFQLEESCIELIATQQPMARDLRTLITILHVAVELERMGDYAEGIGRISLMMGDEPPLKPLIDIPRMAEKATDLLRRSLDALINRDTIAAIGVCKGDDEVDALYDQVYRELLTYMIQDPKTIQRATYLLWVSHDLERIADRATNIAERVIYLVTGKMTEINVSRY
ncbi:MAG: phosphate signaling complex protein PhoU [Chloroflexi bacterium]|nr:phosphate signaling complex protein PhoU [Chloroflexota bacterium]